MRRTRNVVPLIVLAVITGASSAFASGGSIQRFKVTSSLDAKKVLPLRSRWQAIPHISTTEVKKVEFLIDGHWLWTEHATPYFYGGNEGRNGNWLITSFLNPGRHTFTVKLFASGGSIATDNVHARVIQAPPPPSKLAGKWKHHVSASTCAASPGFCDTHGDITESIATLGWGTPPGDYWDARYESGGKVVFGPGVVNPHMSAGARQGGFCNAIDPFHTWMYTVASDDQSFQLSPAGNDPCKTRQLGLEGTWTRAS
jgi:hypothetical protein